MADERVQTLINRLVKAKGWFIRCQIILRPGFFTLLFSGIEQRLAIGFNISPEEVRFWIDDLIHLANVVESLP